MHVSLSCMQKASLTAKHKDYNGEYLWWKLQYCGSLTCLNKVPFSSRRLFSIWGMEMFTWFKVTRVKTAAMTGVSLEAPELPRRLNKSCKPLIVVERILFLNSPLLRSLRNEGPNWKSAFRWIHLPRHTPPFLHSPPPLQACFSSFHNSLTPHTHISPPLPSCYPTPIRPTSYPLTWGIQFVLHVSFLLRFRFISCWLLLINSLDIRQGGGGETEERARETER